MVAFMLLGDSKHSEKVAMRDRQRMRGQMAVQAELIRPSAPGQADDTGNAAARPPSYRRWAGFVAGAQIGDFGFGAYFTDERDLADEAQPQTSMTEYTWSPAKAR
jgi:hypothetical protein